MDIISFSILLEYLYNKFVITFILVLIGSVVRETAISTLKLNEINANKILGSVILSSSLVCVVVDYIDIPFSMYTILCLLVGIWSKDITNILLNNKIMIIIIGKLFNSIKEPVTRSVTEAIIDELEKESEEDSKNNTNDDNK